MSTPNEVALINRRQALARGLSTLASVPLLSGAAHGRVHLAASPEFGPGDNAPCSLLLLQLSGGNDGLSTVVPYADDAYHAARRRTRIEEGSVLELDGLPRSAPVAESAALVPRLRPSRHHRGNRLSRSHPLPLQVLRGLAHGAAPGSRFRRRLDRASV